VREPDALDELAPAERQEWPNLDALLERAELPG
jgi:hypothetical protein